MNLKTLTKEFSGFTQSRKGSAKPQTNKHLLHLYQRLFVKHFGALLCKDTMAANRPFPFSDMQEHAATWKDTERHAGTCRNIREHAATPGRAKDASRPSQPRVSPESAPSQPRVIDRCLQFVLY
jgi:hypothetical protein